MERKGHEDEEKKRGRRGRFLAKQGEKKKRDKDAKQRRGWRQNDVGEKQQDASILTSSCQLRENLPHSLMVSFLLTLNVLLSDEHDHECDACHHSEISTSSHPCSEHEVDFVAFRRSQDS